MSEFKPTRGDTWAAKHNADEAIRLLVLRSTVSKMTLRCDIRDGALQSIDRKLSNLSDVTFSIAKRVAERGRA